MSASGLVEAKQVEIVIELTPPEAFDLDYSTFDPGDSPFSLSPGLDRIGGGQVRGGGASVAVSVNGEASLGSFRLRTADQFDSQSEATVEVILVSIGPSFEERDAFGTAVLDMRVGINLGGSHTGEPELRSLNSVDVSADPSATGSGRELDGSRGEVTFSVAFSDAAQAPTKGQVVTWSITNEGAESVFLLNDGVIEIPPRSTAETTTSTDEEGEASITLDLEHETGSESIAPTPIAAVANTEAPNSAGELRSLTVRFSAAWDLSVAAELARFAAILESGGVLLQWFTSSQSSNLGWQIFRSIESGPYRKIGGFVDGAGTTDEGMTYSFFDDDLTSDGGQISYYLRQIDLDGNSTRTQTLDVDYQPGGVTTQPYSFHLAQSWPNPFNPETAIHFNLPQSAEVSLTIYDAAGQQVRHLVMGRRMAPGHHSVIWNGLNNDGQEVGSGTYLYAFHAGNFQSAGKMTLVR